MCFSAAGSFVVAVALTGAGVASTTRNGSGERRMFAAIPFLFAAQQAAEGMVWLTMGSSSQETLHRVAVNVFLGFALVVWPVWAPVSLQRMERRPARRQALMAFACVGAIVSLSAGTMLALWRPLAVVAGHSIRYDYARSSEAAHNGLLLLAYVVPTVVPFFVSTSNFTRTLGAILVVALMVTVVIQRDTLTSVWCFFAAVLSGLVVVAVRQVQAPRPSSPVAHPSSA